METTMKSAMLHRKKAETRDSGAEPSSTPQRPQRRLMIGKALAIIGVFVLASVAIDRFCNSAAERIEAERSVWYPPYYVQAAYGADFWKMLILHTR
jgi:hypothetical protein